MHTLLPCLDTTSIRVVTTILCAAFHEAEQCGILLSLASRTPQDGTDENEEMLEMAGSDGLMLLAGFTYGSFAASNPQKNMDAVVVILQTTASAQGQMPVPALGLATENSGGGINSIPWVASSAAAVIVAALAFWAWKRGSLTCLFGDAGKALAATSVLGREAHRGDLPPKSDHEADVGTRRGFQERSGVAGRELAKCSHCAVSVHSKTGAGGGSRRSVWAAASRSSTSNKTLKSPTGSSRSSSCTARMESAHFGTVHDSILAPCCHNDTEPDNSRSGRSRRAGGTMLASAVVPRRTQELPGNFPPISASDDVVNPATSSGNSGQQASSSREKTTVGVIQAVLQSAEQIAHNSAIPGVGEAATLVSVLVRLVDDNEGNPGAGEWRVRWCRSILVMLQRAEILLGKVRQLSLKDVYAFPSCYLFALAARVPF